MLPPSHSPHFVWCPQTAIPTQDLPLSGLRLAVKDLFDLQGTVTGCGNPVWADTHGVATNTAEVVQTLLDAGAHIVGKTLTDELAYSLNGTNMHYGTPVNRAAPDRLPGGSSSGSAAAVSFEQADIGLGTDTGGSIRVPAAYNGLFGLRPTHGILSTQHMVGLAPWFDTVGWLTRDLPTLKQVAEVLLPAQTREVEPAQVLEIETLFQQCVYREQTQQTLRNSNLQFDLLSEWPLSAQPDLLSHTFRVLQGQQIIQTHGDWLASYAHSLAPDIQARVAWCRTLDEATIREAEAVRDQFVEQMQICLPTSAVWIIPTTPGPAPLLNSTEDELVHYRQTLMGFTALAGLAGLPQLHLPLFELEGAPCGVSLLAAKHQEWQLIHTAQTLLESIDS